MAKTWKVPEISDKPIEDLESAKTEYRNLTATHHDCPPHGWAHWFEMKFECRFTQLRKAIADFVIESE